MTIKSRPILFSAAMVRAIIDGRKTQTRRSVKFKPPNITQLPYMEYARDGMPIFWSSPPNESIRMSDYYDHGFPCPYGEPGDRLWVRETVKATFSEEGLDCVHYISDDRCRAICDNEATAWAKMRDYAGGRSKIVPSIHMPRWASRITLEITDIGVERLSEISRGDCMAEGCPFPNIAKETDPQSWYRDLWESIHGAGSWSANPWVWVIEFKVV